MSPSHRKYLQRFPVQREKVGKLLAKGKQHLVFAYGREQVLKIPRHSAYNTLYGLIPPSVIEEDLQLLQKYCGAYTPKTIIHLSGRHYVILQQRILEPAFVTQFTLEKVRPQLEELVAAGKALYREQGVFLDLFGYQGMTQSLLALVQANRTRALLTNVVIDFSPQRPRLYLVDTNLTSLPQESHPANLFHRGIDLLTIFLTKVLLYWAFRIRI